LTNTVSEIVSDETLNAIIQIESGGNPRAKAPTSSATGLFQFLNGTWMSLVKTHKPELVSLPPAKLLSLRCDPQLCIELGARFTEDNLALIGRQATGGDLYLAHFLGAGDARKLFRAAPQTPVEELVSPLVVQANRSIMQGKTVAQVRAWAARRMHESAGHDWISRFYVPPDDQPAEPEPAPEPAPEDFPDPQKPSPAPAPKPVEAPAPPSSPVRPDDDEGFLDWLKRKGKTIATWSGIGTTGLGTLGATTDWRIIAVIVGGFILCGVMVGVFYLVSRKASS
jgi:hypothetical protein